MPRARTTRTTVLVGVALGWTLAIDPARAFDHRDGPTAQADPSTDIADVFAWMSPDAMRVNLVMTVSPGATVSAKFSNAAHYVFHVTSRSSVAAAAAASVDVICDFHVASSTTECWVGSVAHVVGDASAPAGLVSGDGKVRVFAGLRDDPAFVNVDGLRHMQSLFLTARGGLGSDVAGCPTVTSPSTFTSALVQNASGGAPANLFAGQNVLALALSVDATLLTSGGPILGVWGSTNR